MYGNPKLNNFSKILSFSKQDANYGVQKSKEMLDLDDRKKHPSHSLHDVEGCAGSTNNKHFLPSVSAGCCESGQTSSDQDCFIVDGNIEEQISSHFQHNSAMNHEEEMEMTFPRSVYGEIGDKDIGSFHSEGTFLCVVRFV